jgi:hypothetical protein
MAGTELQGPHTEQHAMVAYWKERMRELPDIRMNKVRDTRDALEQNSYDTEPVLEATLERMCEETGILS